MASYQEAAINAVHEMISVGSPRKAMVVMATGLGKTFTAAEAIRRARQNKTMRVSVSSHTQQAKGSPLVGGPLLCSDCLFVAHQDAIEGKASWGQPWGHRGANKGFAA